MQGSTLFVGFVQNEHLCNDSQKRITRLSKPLLLYSQFFRTTSHGYPLFESISRDATDRAKDSRLKFGSWRSEIAKQSTQTHRRNNAGRQRRGLDKYRR